MIPFLVYLVSNAFFTYLDLTGKPAALLKYKIQEEKGVPVSWDEFNCMQDSAIGMERCTSSKILAIASPSPCAAS